MDHADSDSPSSDEVFSDHNFVGPGDDRDNIPIIK
jgi:hypothetical protein